MPPPTKGIQGKKAASRVSAIKRKVEAGEATGNERAYVRVGKANTRILTGQEDVSLWSDEELKRGQRKDKNGRWQGQPPKVVPKHIHDELVRRTISKANVIMRDNLEAAVAILTEIAKDEDAEHKDRLRAVAMIMDRVMGKDPQKVEVSGETPPWQVAIQKGIVTIKSGDLLGDDEDDDEEETE